MRAFTILVSLLALAMAGCGGGPQPDQVTAAPEALDATRVERVLDAFPRFLAWARTVEARGAKIQGQVDRSNPAGWVNAARFGAEMADGAAFVREVGMPAEEFFRDWALIAAAYGAVAASDGLAAARAEMRRTMDQPGLPPEQRALLEQQLAAMEVSAPPAPAANQELIRRYRARLEQLMNTAQR